MIGEKVMSEETASEETALTVVRAEVEKAIRSKKIGRSMSVSMLERPEKSESGKVLITESSQVIISDWFYTPEADTKDINAKICYKHARYCQIIGKNPDNIDQTVLVQAGMRHCWKNGKDEDAETVKEIYSDPLTYIRMMEVFWKAMDTYSLEKPELLIPTEDMLDDEEMDLAIATYNWNLMIKPFSGYILTQTRETDGKKSHKYSIEWSGTEKRVGTGKTEG